jgi:hypothetical protein
MLVLAWFNWRNISITAQDRFTTACDVQFCTFLALRVVQSGRQTTQVATLVSLF